MLSIQSQLILTAIEQMPEDEKAALMIEIEKRKIKVTKPKKQPMLDPHVLASQFLEQHRRKHSSANKLA